jgi:DNA-binding response OmpR family regulator
MPLNVLVVEDDHILRNTIVEFAAKQHYDAHDAATGEAALNHVNSHAVDILITDWDLGTGMDGIQLAEYAITHRPMVKVILITAKSIDSLHEQCDFVHRFTVLQKPFSLRTLRRTLREISGKTE